MEDFFEKGTLTEEQMRKAMKQAYQPYDFPGSCHRCKT